MRTRVSKVCFRCKKEYKTRNYSQKYCSAKCREFQYKQDRGADCIRCGKLINSTNSSSMCQKCYNASLLRVIKCTFCGNDFHASGNGKSKFCSQRCRGGYFNAKENAKRVGKKTWKNYKRPMSNLWDESWLRHQYIDLRKSAVTISTELGVSHQTVYYWLKCFDIDTSYKIDRHPRWRTGRYLYGGYYWIRGENGKPQQEHRYVMEKHIGRKLARSEIVHHIDGDPLNNKIDNLKLVSRTQHIDYTYICSDCPLKKEVRLLRWQIKELSAQLSSVLTVMDKVKERDVGLTK